ncbi:MAG: hypothetical protein ABF804_03900 [Liquorilactobacillus ghanensis]|uniref:Uncharacterized protein n=1 Tax=Liquorilactobacillus ghanensis DSM 18630 TaxID=1423750 RepID=A0A0R1VKV0_9LACO|nr:hypothetical protein [Liquorilactobacillus ghanensis]KRM06215.1 hypothetical protein FC89_GL001087 [Liquorilactobacillus ghanensis DSM 18630]
MLEEYLISGVSKKEDRRQVVKDLIVRIKQKKSGKVQSTTGDLFLPDIEIIYYFNQRQILQIDYAFSDSVSLEAREFWENLIEMLTNE